MWLSYLDKEVEYCVKDIMIIFVLKGSREPRIGESGGCNLIIKRCNHTMALHREIVGI